MNAQFCPPIKNVYLRGLGKGSLLLKITMLLCKALPPIVKDDKFYKQ